MGLNELMHEEWRKLSIPTWRSILAESIAQGNKRREAYARWMLRDVLGDFNSGSIDTPVPLTT